MKKAMFILAGLFSGLFILCLLAYSSTCSALWETLAISMGVTAYHFLMRLAIGYALDTALKNKVDPTKKWFQITSFEQKVYHALRVKHWKKRMPTFVPDYFDIKKHTIDEILGATCQAELVHETIILFSFLPILLTKWFNSFGTFAITSLAAALLDSVFVILQRFNRPRLLKLRGRRMGASAHPHTVPSEGNAVSHQGNAPREAITEGEGFLL